MARKTVLWQMRGLRVRTAIEFSSSGRVPARTDEPGVYSVVHMCIDSFGEMTTVKRDVKVACEERGGAGVVLRRSCITP